MASERMSVKQAAERLGLHPWSVYKLIEAGTLPAHRIGPRAGKVVLDADDIDRYWRESKAKVAEVSGPLDRHARRPRTARS